MQLRALARTIDRGYELVPSFYGLSDGDECACAMQVRLGMG